MGTPISNAEEKLTRQILRVDHAGEHAAISIYRAQIAAVARRHPGLLPWLNETLAHEMRHRDVFLDAMRERAITPCGALAVWSVGGTLLGGIMGRLGPFGVMVCTAAVERTVHKHLDHQIAFLDGRDAGLAGIVRDIQQEEAEHLSYAESRHNPRGMFATLIGGCVSGATALLIWTSTQGSSLRLGGRLKTFVGASRRS